MTNKTNGPTVGPDGKPTNLLSVNSQYRIENKTISPDQLLSLTTMLMNYTAMMLSKYTEKYPEIDGGGPVTYQEVLDKMVQASNIYKLVDSGMSPEDASEIMGMKTECYEIPQT